MSLFQRKIAKRILFLLFIVAILTVRYFSALPEFNEQYIGSYIGKKLTLKGQIVQPPEEGIYSTFEVEVNAFQHFEKWYPLQGAITVHFKLFEELNYGDTLIFSGILELPFRKDPRIAAELKDFKIRSIQKTQTINFLAFLHKFKTLLTKRLNQLFPEPASSFAAGILLGSRSSIPKEILDDFKRTGLSHILALSGYNIVILIVFISAVFSIFPRKTSSILCIFIIAVFTILVGASASIVRAAIMGSLTLTARIFGRNAKGLRLLFISAIIMAFFDPFIVFYDISFQLSFSATAGILFFSDRLQTFLQKIPNWFGMRDSISATGASQIFTLPFIMFYFKSFSIIAPVANVIVLPFIPILMLGSFLSLIFGKIIAFPAWILFEAVLKIIHIFAQIPFSFMDFGIS